MLDALVRRAGKLIQLGFQCAQDCNAVFVGFGDESRTVHQGVSFNLCCPRFGSLDDAPLRHEHDGMLLRCCKRLLGLVVRLVHDPIAIFVDAFCQPYLFRDSDAHLVYDVEKGLVCHDHIPCQRDACALVKEILETVNQSKDVDSYHPFATASGFLALMSVTHQLCRNDRFLLLRGAAKACMQCLGHM